VADGLSAQAIGLEARETCGDEVLLATKSLIENLES